MTRRNGHLCRESHPITDTEPAASSTRNAAPTLTDLRFQDGHVPEAQSRAAITLGRLTVTEA
jgi:hypothetical protein